MKIFRILLVTLLLGVVACNNDDSINESLLDGQFCNISKECLGEWDWGIARNSLSVLCKYNHIDYITYNYLNNNYSNDNGIILLCNSDNKLTGISCKNNYYAIIHTNNELIINRVVNGYIESETISIRKLSKQSKTRSESLPFFDNITTLTDIWGYIQDANMLKNDIIDMQWGDFFADLGGVLAEAGLSALGTTGALVAAPFEIVLGAIEKSAQNNSAKIYGDSSIEISEIRRGPNGNLEVYVTIENINTIPKYLFRYYEHDENEVTRNKVYCGVIGRSKGMPTLHWHDKKYESVEKEIPADASANTLYLMFTIPDIPSGKEYKFRPYLKSTRITNILGRVDEAYMRYGNAINYMSIYGTWEITYDSIYNQSLNGGKPWIRVEKYPGEFITLNEDLSGVWKIPDGKNDIFSYTYDNTHLNIKYTDYDEEDKYNIEKLEGDSLVLVLEENNNDYFYQKLILMQEGGRK